MKKKDGRKCKCTRALVDLAKDYVNGCWTDQDAIPQKAGLAKFCGISESTLHKWISDDDKSEEKKEFSELCTRVMSDQKRSLINYGLTRQFDSSLTKLLLMKHGYSDRQEIDHTTAGKSINEPTQTAIEIAREQIRKELEEG